MYGSNDVLIQCYNATMLKCYN